MQERTLAELKHDDAEAVREAWRSIAVCLVGYGAADEPKGRRVAYQDIVGPGETTGMRRDMLRMSGCGLVAGCCWRCGGVRDGLLAPPYRLGWAIDRLRVLGLRAEACVTPTKQRTPGIGDTIYVGAPKPPKPKEPSKLHAWELAVAAWRALYGGEAHVEVVTELGPKQLVVVAGGQTDKEGKQTIKRLERDIAWRGDKLWIGGRRCSWFIDCTKLEYASPWTLPVPGPGIKTYDEA